MRFLDLCSSRWLFQALARISLPVLVTRILLANPLRVFILGTGGGLLGGARDASLPARREDHEKVLAFEERLAPDYREGTSLISHPLPAPPPHLLVPPL